ncbi:type II toxin-antitoxin system RatA family toxin [Halocatena halophila]|uniref:type II toxin-antitoxin system RatA family toxin n=1 Tax=Halocatena halophila TaxID=2814576 RepID=UPI002ED3E693
MNAVEASTVVYVPPTEVYEFLEDFTGYAGYSEYIQEIHADGDGGPGTTYDITFAWWKLSYTARSTVTDIEPPERIDWKISKDIDARGHWQITPAPEQAPENHEHASRVVLQIEFDPSSANKNAIDLPPLVGLDWVIGKVKPKIEREATRVVERIVADLEGEQRPVTVDIETRS